MKLDLSIPTDVNRYQTYGRKLLQDGAKVEIKKINKPKSVSQNAYAHVVFCLFGIEYGYTLQETKTEIKRALGFFYEKNGAKFLKSVADMDTVEVGQMIDYARDVAGQNGCYIPSPEEYLTNKFSIDKEIDSHAKYLQLKK